MSAKDYGPADAKALAATGMSHTKIAEKLGVAPNTISRWKRNEWRRLNDPTPADKLAKEAVKVAAVKKQTTEEILQAKLAAMKVDAATLDDIGLLKETARRTLITVCVALEFANTNAPELVKKKPREIGALIKDCGDAVAKAHEGWDRYLAVLRGLHGQPSEEEAPVAAKMEPENPLRDVMARLEASLTTRKKAAEAVPGSSSVQ